MTAEEAFELQEIYRRYRMRLHHLVLNGLPARVPASDFDAERRAVRAAWSRHFGA